MNVLDRLLSRNLLPDPVVRFGIRNLLGQRLREEAATHRQQASSYLTGYAADLRQRAIAEQTGAANEQHYEVPAEFYQLCLGPRLKYSSCYYPTGTETLAEAEQEMLQLYLQRAELKDGQTILDLGCGWGSLSLYLAERFPRSEITAVSNSTTQRAFIEKRATQRGLVNLRVLTCDMNDFDAEADFYDRVVSVEMFEHMKNYERLLAKVARWLRSDGRLFVHIFTHQRYAYHFEPRGPSDWMARHFFTGGQMPSHDLLAQFQSDLRLCQEWKVNGRHYEQTAEHWLQNMDRNRKRVMSLFTETYGTENAERWWAYWRTFFLSCAELWGYRGGDEWIVSHYLFAKQSGATA